MTSNKSRNITCLFVIPAEAGIQSRKTPTLTLDPAFAGVTTNSLTSPQSTVDRSVPGGRLDLSRLRRDLAPGPRPRQPVDDDPVARRQTRAAYPEAVVGPRTRRGDLLLEVAVRLPGHPHLWRMS